MKKFLLVLLIGLLLSCGRQLDWGDYELTVVYLSGDKDTFMLHNCTEPYENYHYGSLSIGWKELNDDASRIIRYRNTVPISHYYVKWIDKKE